MSYGKSYFKNKHMYIFIFIILLLILTYYINLQVNRINTLKEEITSLEKKHHLIFKKLTIAQNEAQTNSAYFKKVNSCLFISEINDMAQKTNLQILNFETEKNQEFAAPVNSIFRLFSHSNF